MARKLTGLAEARRIVVERCARFPSEQVPLEQALGRALADEVRSEAAIPPFDNSLMDGFARVVQGFPRGHSHRQHALWRSLWQLPASSKARVNLLPNPE